MRAAVIAERMEGIVKGFVFALVGKCCVRFQVADIVRINVRRGHCSNDGRRGRRGGGGGKRSIETTHVDWAPICDIIQGWP